MSWEEFDKSFDVEGLKADVKVAEQSSPHKEVPYGEYIVKVDKISAGKSQKGDPKVNIQFRIIAGDYANHCLFMNQLLTTGMGVHMCNTMLRELTKECEPNVPIEFKGFRSYASMLDMIMAMVEKFEYRLHYSKNAKGYLIFEIKEIFKPKVLHNNGGNQVIDNRPHKAVAAPVATEPEPDWSTEDNYPF